MTNDVDVIFGDEDQEQHSEHIREDGTLKPQHENYNNVIWDGRNGGLQ